MKVNGKVYSDLTDVTMQNEDINGYGIKDRTVNYIIIHGTATTNVESVINTFKRGSTREASAEYLVTPDSVIGFGGENFVHWHCGGGDKVNNFNAIGIEHINSSIKDISDYSTYLFDNRTLERGAKLVADICTRYNIPADREHILPHSDLMNTSCPQTINMDEYIKLVQSFLKPSTPNKVVDKYTDSDTKTYAERGIFTCTIHEGIYYRTAPNVNNSQSVIVGAIEYMDRVSYDTVVWQKTGHIFVSWIGEDGGRRYLPIKTTLNWNTLEVWGTVE